MGKCLFQDKYPTKGEHCKYGNDKCCNECNEQPTCDKACATCDDCDLYTDK